METKDWVARMHILLATFELFKQSDTPTLSPKDLKRSLLSSLLSGEIAPNEFKGRVKESGLSTRVLTEKHLWQSELEFFGKDATVFFGKDEFTLKEVFDRFEDFSEQIAAFRKQNISRFTDLRFPNDPDAIINKLSDASLSDEERKHIYEAYNERWSIPSGEV